MNHWVTIPAALNPARTGDVRKVARDHYGGDPSVCPTCKAFAEGATESVKLREEIKSLQQKLNAAKDREATYIDKLRQSLNRGQAGLPPEESTVIDATTLHLYDAALVYVEVASRNGPCIRSAAAMVAWRDDPVRWGLKGFEQISSDAHIISKYLTLHVQAGNLSRPFQGLYHLSQKGREYLSALSRSARRVHVSPERASRQDSAATPPDSQPADSSQRSPRRKARSEMPGTA